MGDCDCCRPGGYAPPRSAVRNAVAHAAARGVLPAAPSAAAALERLARWVLENRDLLDSALADAAEHREESGWCDDCGDQEQPCFDHDADWHKAGAYELLRGQIRDLP